MKIAVYALARNEEANVGRWAASCHGADEVVVTDTGSTDGTVAALRRAGVAVNDARILPWRWDDAHNASLHAVSDTADVAIRLDLDETLVDGWRAIVERAWQPDTTKLLYRYRWTADGVNPPLLIHLDRVHSRNGYRWQGATHEGLVAWAIEERQAVTDELLVLHHRPADKDHPSDLVHLRRAIEESPHDARMRWYFARELDYAHDPAAAGEFRAFLRLRGGSPTERAHACIRLSLLEKTQAKLWLRRATAEAPEQPEAYCRLAYDALTKGDAIGALALARQAIACPDREMDHTSEPRAYPERFRLATRAAIAAGRWSEAAFHAAAGLVRSPGDAELAEVVARLGESRDGPRD